MGTCEGSSAHLQLSSGSLCVLQLADLVLDTPRDPVFSEEMFCCSPEQKTLFPSPVIGGISEEFIFFSPAQFLLSIQQQKPLSLQTAAKHCVLQLPSNF